MQTLDWNGLDAAGRIAALSRPALNDLEQRAESVRAIVRAVRDNGDAALRSYAQQFDGVDVRDLVVPQDEIDTAGQRLDATTRAAIDLAFNNLQRFHESSARLAYALETMPGVHCRRLVRPLSIAGLYVPADLPSTALMLGVPAMLAGCETTVLCTPPSSNEIASAAILYAAKRCGVTQVVRAGGAQAIAAMAYGTESVPRVDCIFGPGNAWVTEAKRQVADDSEGALVDMPAGPSEVLVIADDAANPAFIAADLLSQAEHGPDSQVLLVTSSGATADAVRVEVARQLAQLPRAAIARKALSDSRIIHVNDLATALDVSNRYAPEHLILNVAEPEALLPAIRNAGSVFLGPWTPESLGDYVSGTNHVLPTYGRARQLGGLSVADFQKCITVQSANADGLRAAGPAAIALARAEGMEAHARAVGVRLDALELRRERA